MATTETPVLSIWFCTMKLATDGEHLAPLQRIPYEEEKPGLRMDLVRAGSTVTGEKERSISRLQINSEGSHREMTLP